MCLFISVRQSALLFVLLISCFSHPVLRNFMLREISIKMKANARSGECVSATIQKNELERTECERLWREIYCECFVCVSRARLNDSEATKGPFSDF